MSSSAPSILLTGSSGFIGSALKAFLEGEGFTVFCLKRGEPSTVAPFTLFWDPLLRRWNPADFEGFHAVIHLAGEGIANGRWTAQRKKRLLSSRLQTTDALSEILCALSSPPQLLISASAVGFYGNQPGCLLTEDSPRGQGFLADLCDRWELAAKKVEQRGIRLIHARFGLVLGKEGGVLHKLLPLFRWGLGGKLGSGQQFVSWISLYDLVRGMLFCLQHTSVQGAVNFVAPHPIPQHLLVRQLAHQLRRPAGCHLPAWLLRSLLGEMADEVLLTCQRAEPRRLLAQGFVFAHPDVETALQAILGPPRDLSRSRLKR